MTDKAADYDGLSWAPASMNPIFSKPGLVRLVVSQEAFDALASDGNWVRVAQDKPEAE